MDYRRFYKNSFLGERYDKVDSYLFHTSEDIAADAASPLANTLHDAYFVYSEAVYAVEPRTHSEFRQCIRPLRDIVLVLVDGVARTVSPASRLGRDLEEFRRRFLGAYEIADEGFASMGDEPII